MNDHLDAHQLAELKAAMRSRSVRWRRVGASTVPPPVTAPRHCAWAR